MKTKFICALLLSVAFLFSAGSAPASPIDTIQFQDGNVLNIQGSFGSGADAAYLVVDLNNAGVNYAWQFNWNPATTVNGWQMLEDIAGQSNLTTSGMPGTTTFTDPAGDPNLSLNATYFASFAEHEILNFQYGSTVGSNASWDFFTGAYNSANVSAVNPQGMTWASSGVGIDAVNLTAGKIIGWVDVQPHPPNPVLPETEISQVSIPEPGAAVLLGVLAGWRLTWRSRRRVDT